jgi:hypothetical protein
MFLCSPDYTDFKKMIKQILLILNAFHICVIVS